MKSSPSTFTWLSLFLFLLIASASSVRVEKEKAAAPGIGSKSQVYLVYYKYSQGGNKQEIVNQILQQALGSVEAARRALIYCYQFPLFAARLSPSQLNQVKNNPNVEAVEKDGTYHVYSK